MKRRGPIFLVGMMGAGKSTVGALLARRLGRSFVDSDEVIEERAGHSIARIFEREGEAGFRKRERAAIEAAAEGDAVVALGGGAVAQPGALEHLAARGPVVYLEVPLETLLDNVGEGRGRPLLEGLDLEERRTRLETLLDARRPYYEAATHRVDGRGAPDRVAARIAAVLEDSDDAARIDASVDARRNGEGSGR